MDRIDTSTPDIERENLDRLCELFPSVATEVAGDDGTTHRAVDLDALRELVGDVAEGARERYQFTWPGKREAKAEAYRPIDKTMRPERERSVDWDTTRNLYIEGDNLEALKLLRNTYAGKVKLIYIDPPYNTGHDFVYDDDFAQTRAEYDAASGDYDEGGGRLVENPESNGRFHSDWCSMIYPRLILARDLLSSDGAIFISLDDNECSNAVKICDEIFGMSNRVAIICHKSRASVSNDKIISPNHNFILFYAKDFNVLNDMRKNIGVDPDIDGFDEDDQDGRGPYRLVPVDGPGGAKKGNPYFDFLGVSGYWRFSKQTMEQKYCDGLIVKKGNSLYQKYFLSTAIKTRKTVTTWWDDGGLTSTATSKLKGLMDGAAFDTPKPVGLIYRMIQMLCFYDDDAIIMDFFSGSATTAQAVFEANAHYGGSRHFILVQLPELIPDTSDAIALGYDNICQVGEERIRRAGAKIKADLEETNRQLKIGEEPKQVLDIGFRVLRIDSSNFEDTYETPDAYTQGKLAFFRDNLKTDRSDLDLLFQVLPAFRIPYSAKIEEIDVCGRRAFDVNGGQLVACFDADVSTECIEAIARKRPLYAVLRDASLADDATAANFEELFKTYSPDTVRRVI